MYVSLLERVAEKRKEKRERGKTVSQILKKDLDPLIGLKLSVAKNIYDKIIIELPITKNRNNNLQKRQEFRVVAVQSFVSECC
jgi:hypothetical protein